MPVILDKIDGLHKLYFCAENGEQIMSDLFLNWKILREGHLAIAGLLI
jgi:hypothetical protein